VGAALKQSWGQLGGDTLSSSYSATVISSNYWNANIVTPTPCISFLPFLFHFLPSSWGITLQIDNPASCRGFSCWMWGISSKSLQHCAAAALASTVLLGLLLCPWMWIISSQPLQLHIVTAPVPTTGDPVVKTSCFHCRRYTFHPQSGKEDLTCSGKEKNLVFIPQSSEILVSLSTQVRYKISNHKSFFHFL